MRTVTRPAKAGGYAVAQQIDPPLPMQDPEPVPMPEGDGDRNANPLYDFPNMDVRYHFISEMPLRVSAIRSLGAHLEHLQPRKHAWTNSRSPGSSIRSPSAWRTCRTNGPGRSWNKRPAVSVGHIVVAGLVVEAAA